MACNGLLTNLMTCHDSGWFLKRRVAEDAELVLSISSAFSATLRFKISLALSL